MKPIRMAMIICWGILCLGLLWPVVIYMRLAHTVGRAAAYVMVVIGLGFVVALAILRQQRWLIAASLLPAILALLMAYPFFVLFHPLLYFSPEMDQLPGPGTLLLLVYCGLPVATCALPYAVAFAIWAIVLTDRERRKVSALKSASTSRDDKGTIDESTEDIRE